MRPPSSRPKPSKPSLLGKRPFLPGFSTALFGFFGLWRRLRSLRPVLAPPSLHPKIPFLAAAFPRTHTARCWGNWSFEDTKSRSVIIPDSVRGLQTVGSTPRGHREVARLRRRAANGLRPPPVAGQVQMDSWCRRSQPWPWCIPHGAVKFALTSARFRDNTVS